MPESRPAKLLSDQSRFSRRELNFAESRVELLDAAKALSAERGASAVTADAIADAAGVSRMTFFNRFREKDAIWLYYAWTWALRLSVQQHVEPRTGSAAIRRIFREVALIDSTERPFYRGFLAFVANSDVPHDLLAELQPGPAEKALLHPSVPDAADIRIIPIYTRLVRHVEEAMASGETASGEIAADADAHDVAKDLAALMYGELFLAIINGSSDPGPRFERGIDRILGCSSET